MYHCWYMLNPNVCAPNIPTKFKHLQSTQDRFLFPGPPYFFWSRQFCIFCSLGLCSHDNLHSGSFSLHRNTDICRRLTFNIINFSKPFSHFWTLFERSRKSCGCFVEVLWHDPFTTGWSSMLSCSCQLKLYKHNNKYTLLWYSHKHVDMMKIIQVAHCQE